MNGLGAYLYSLHFCFLVFAKLCHCHTNMFSVVRHCGIFYVMIALVSGLIGYTMGSLGCHATCSAKRTSIAVIQTVTNLEHQLSHSFSRSYGHGNASGIWLFDSGIMLEENQIRQLAPNALNRFSHLNIWEAATEAYAKTALLKSINNRECSKDECVVLDCGAAFGYYSIVAKRTTPKLQIHALNPISEFATAILQA
jgi:hypothetical protein